MSKQTVKDRVNGAVQSVVGDGTSLIIYKATTEEPIAPKEKHVMALSRITDYRDTSVSKMSEVFAERLANTNFYVVIKALSVTHYLMVDGSQRFFSFLATDFRLMRSALKLDTRRPDGRAAIEFAQKYLDYLKVKCEVFCELGFDVNNIGKGSHPQSLQHRDIKILISICSQLSRQSEALFVAMCDSFQNYNAVGQYASSLLKRESVTLYLCLNDAAIGIIEKFFVTDKKLARQAFVEYEKFIGHCAQFSKVFGSIRAGEVENVPAVTMVPASLLDSMRSHLESADKPRAVGLQPQTIKKPVASGKKSDCGTGELDLLDFGGNPSSSDLFELTDSPNLFDDFTGGSALPPVASQGLSSDLFDVSSKPLTTQPVSGLDNDFDDIFSHTATFQQSTAPPKTTDDPFFSSNPMTDPFTGPQATTDLFLPNTAQADPFSSSATQMAPDPLFSSVPHTTTGAFPAYKTDPFAFSSTQMAADPFSSTGQGTNTAALPSMTGLGATDPFAFSSTQMAADPFPSTSQGKNDLFFPSTSGHGATDPFAFSSNQTTGQGTNTAAFPSMTGLGATDPFFSSPAARKTTDPFHSSTTQHDDPFSSIGQTTTDLFSSSAQTATDPFSSTGQTAADPFSFAVQTSTDPFFSTGQGRADPFQFSTAQTADPFSSSSRMPTDSFFSQTKADQLPSMNMFPNQPGMQNTTNQFSGSFGGIDLFGDNQGSHNPATNSVPSSSGFGMPSNPPKGDKSDLNDLFLF